MSNDFLELQNSVAEEFRRDAQAALDLAWPGKTLVTVKVELDNDGETRIETIVPDEPVPRSDRKSTNTTETGIRTSVASEGQETTQSSVPTSKSKDDTRDVEFLVDAGERRIWNLFPDIESIRCSVLIDENDANLASRVEAIRDLVMPITGITNRQDVTVTVFPFPEPEPIPTPVGPSFMDTVREWGPIGGQVLGVLLVLLFLRGMLKRAASVTATTRATGAGDVEDELDPKAASRQIRREIEKTISEDPAAISRLLESWLDEQKV